MDTDTFLEVKDSLKEFQDILKTELKEDKNAPAEAKELLAKVESINSQIKNMKSVDELKALMGPFAWDFIQVMSIIQEMNDDQMDFDDEFDEEDSEFDDEDSEFDDEESDY